VLGVENDRTPRPGPRGPYRETGSQRSQRELSKIHRARFEADQWARMACEAEMGIGLPTRAYWASVVFVVERRKRDLLSVTAFTDQVRDPSRSLARLDPSHLRLQVGTSTRSVYRRRSAVYRVVPTGFEPRVSTLRAFSRSISLSAVMPESGS
jgi:hypothetical protein